MTNLRDTLTSADKKPAVVADLGVLVENEVSGLGGLTGIAAKAAYAAAKAKDSNIAQRAGGAYLGTLADALDPFWSSFTSSGGGDFGAYLAQREAEVAPALQRAMEAEAPAAGSQRAMFDRFKPQAVKVLTGALPRLGALVQKHAS